MVRFGPGVWDGDLQYAAGVQRCVLVLALFLLACSATKQPGSIPPAAPDPAPEIAPEDDRGSFEDLEGEQESEPAGAEAPLLPNGCAPTAGAIDPDAQFERTRAYVDLVLRFSAAPSVAVAVGHAGEMVWAEGFGFANKARRRRATADTPYSLASISKPFTATGIMVLRERGQLKLEAPINTYLGETGVHAGVGDPAEATVERVANHTAGLPLHYRFFPPGSTLPDYATTRRDFAVLVTKPGERYQYSNLGYGLLEQVIVNVSGESYADFMEADVFTPLGLDHTSVGAPRGAAVRYDRRGKPIPRYGFDHDGASAIYSSARDLVAFGMTHLGFVRAGAKPLLPPESIARMREVKAPSVTYGIGWSVRQVGGHTLINHSGGMPGVTTVLAIIPDHALVVAVLVNGEVGNAAHQLVDTIYTDLALPVRADAICRLPTAHPLLGRYEGTLAGPRGVVPLALTIESEGKVEASIDGGVPLPLWQVRVDDDGNLVGGTFTDFGAPAAGGKPSELAFDLQLRDARLTGSVTAMVEGVGANTYFAEMAKQ